MLCNEQTRGQSVYPISCAEFYELQAYYLSNFHYNLKNRNVLCIVPCLFARDACCHLQTSSDANYFAKFYYKYESELSRRLLIKVIVLSISCWLPIEFIVIDYLTTGISFYLCLSFITIFIHFMYIFIDLDKALSQ